MRVVLGDFVLPEIFLPHPNPLPLGEGADTF